MFLLFAPLCLVVQWAAAENQASNLAARHAEGQTILTWTEAEAVSVQELTCKDLKAARAESEKNQVAYRIYRSAKPIESLEGLEPVATVPAYSCWNGEYYGVYPKPEHKALRYAVEDGKDPVPPGTGICAFNPKEAGEAYYAVTFSSGGNENKDLGGTNVLKTAVKETTGDGPFILQRTETPEKFNYVQKPTLHYYVRWEGPPRCSIGGRPFDYVVAIPHNLAKPAPVGIHLHCWGANLNGGYGWWYKGDDGAILIATNQIPYDWWTGYHEFMWIKEPKAELWKDGQVRPFTPNRLWSFFEWVAGKWEIDRSRTFMAGNSMGGSGTGMLAIRYGERIAWATGWVGVHDPGNSPQFTGSYENAYGKKEWGIAFEDGTPVFDYYKDAWWLRKYPEKETAFLTFSNGKNDSAIGWPQAVEFARALQETKRPHLFVWGQSGHGQRASLPLSLSDRHVKMDIRLGQSLPAFSACSLDNNPGNGDKNDGDPSGQFNQFLYWDTGDVVDEADKWEMTLALVEKAPQDECTVEVTPRRLQAFKLKPGDKVTWINTALAGDAEVGRGEAVVNEHGFVTIPQVKVAKTKNRLKLAKH